MFVNQRWVATKRIVAVVSEVANENNDSNVLPILVTSTYTICVRDDYKIFVV